jgi:hypothetical protein
MRRWRDLKGTTSMGDHVNWVVHCWDDGLDYSIGARLDADKIWRAAVDAWVSPDPNGAFRVVGSERAERHGRMLLRLTLQHVDTRSIGSPGASDSGAGHRRP